VTLQSMHLDMDRFRSAIVKRVGLQFDDARVGFLAEVLQRRMSKLGCSGDDYLHDLERASSNGEFNALARELTVGETYFFRNHEQFKALAEVALPERMRIDRVPRTLRLLSAGCASGEEAYSLAIVARETIADPSWEVEIRAVDLNPGALEKAARARYSPWALRETLPDMQRKWFRIDGGSLLLDESIRSAVKFELANLAGEQPGLWLPETYDVVFCRNVLMYFAPDQMRAAIERIAHSLAPGGFLFLGHAETLRGVSDAFHLRHTHDTFYYERKGSISRPASRSVEPVVRRAAPGTPGALGDDAWFHTIRQATDRVAALMSSSASADTSVSPPTPAWDVAPAFDLLRQERFAEALNHVRAGPPAVEQDADVLLLKATLLVHHGQISGAEDACRRLLLIDELNAGAHYVLGLCREHSSDRDGANEHYQVAAYLDPEFAMPRLHMGLLARRAGDRDAARRELSQALVLLRREDSSRLLLFGGGFNREALMGLCRSALKEAGGRS
jgi:chemotaxis protein methyltransferase CheR